ncbi:hypothetical protein GCM10018790_05140 [Kitasatospora xanthocidica]|nr:hypothetical protein GCM10018790_05140 [Kitasatospora xanthocidica]
MTWIRSTPTSGPKAAGSSRFAAVTGPVAPVAPVGEAEPEPEAEDAGVGTDPPGVAGADALWDAPLTAAPDGAAGCAVVPGGAGRTNRPAASPSAEAATRAATADRGRTTTRPPPAAGRPVTDR